MQSGNGEVDDNSGVHHGTIPLLSADLPTTELPTTELGGEPLPAVTDLLPRADAELMVITDTHLVDTSTPHAREFASRLCQNERIATALRVVAGTGVDRVVHLGDLVQDYPENPTHEGLLALAARQVRAAAGQVWFAPGNTDIGDKPDPSSPAAPVSGMSLDRWTGETGGGWTSFRHDDVHGIVLAASLFNSGLPAEQEQWDWFEAELAASTSRWRLLFWHYPTYWRSPSDPGLGNYDVVGEPARTRLTELALRHRVAGVFTGHSHFAFLNRLEDLRMYGVPSTSFTRPGFSELFSGPAPAGHGRDDVAKLGLHLVRLHGGSDATLRVHQVRTGLLTERLKRTPGARPVITAAPADLPGAALGVIARHPIARIGEVPDVFPSVRRGPVRDDYPLLACLELGAGQVSVAPEDLTDPDRGERLALLRAEGVSIAVRLLWPAETTPDVPWSSGDAPVDEVELVLLDRSTLTDTERDWLRGIVADGSLPPVRLATLMRTARGSAELPRWRYGFTGPEIAALGEISGVARLLACSTDGEASASRLRSTDGEASASRLRSTDGEATRSTDGEATRPSSEVEMDLVYELRPNLALADLAEAFIEACRAGHRLLVDGLIELDRTLDVRPGLLDRIGNPTPYHRALAVLNTALHGADEITRDGDRYRVVRDGQCFVVDLRRTGGPINGAPPEVIDLSDAMTSRPEECSGPWLEIPATPQRSRTPMEPGQEGRS